MKNRVFLFDYTEACLTILKKDEKSKAEKQAYRSIFAKALLIFVFSAFTIFNLLHFFIRLIFLRVNRLAIEAKIPRKKYAQKVCTVQNFLYLCSTFRKNAGH